MLTCRDENYNSNCNYSVTSKSFNKPPFFVAFFDTLSITESESNFLYSFLPSERKETADKKSKNLSAFSNSVSVSALLYLALSCFLTNSPKAVKADKGGSVIPSPSINLHGFSFADFKENEAFIKHIAPLTGWDTDSYGKPFHEGISLDLLQSLPLGDTPLDFEAFEKRYGSKRIYPSLSHSENLTAVALSPHPVGLDIEQIPNEGPLTSNNSERLMKLTNRFFHQEECDRLARSSGDKDDLFYKLWTGKESVVKLDGRGISKLKEFYVDEQGVFTLSGKKGQVFSQKLSLETVKAVRSFYVSVAFYL